MSKPKSPTAPKVSIEVWRELYHAANAFQILAPWRWMHDRHVLGIENEHGVRLISVLGKLNEVYGLASYRGSYGTSFLLHVLLNNSDGDASGAALCQDALVAEFAPARELRREDRAVINQLCFKPLSTRPRLFPKFASHSPGYVPWFVSEDEAVKLADDLQKTTRFAEMFRAHPELYESRKPNEFPFFPAPKPSNLSPRQLQWHTLVPAPLPTDPPVEPEAVEAALLLRLPQDGSAVWELNSFYSRDTIVKPPRPYWSKMAMGVDAHSGLVLGFHLGGPELTMAQNAAMGLAQAIRTSGFRPSTLKVEAPPLIQVLEPIARALKIKLVLAKSLPMAREARIALEAYSRRR
jgi:hypothetical protein